MVDPTLVQNWRNCVRNQPKLCADGTTIMAEAHDGLIVAAFLDGPDRRVLSVHQHLRSQEEEVVVVAGVDIEVGIHLNVYHRDSRQLQEIEDNYFLAPPTSDH